MADFRAVKRVSTLPGTLTADTLYAVRTGAGFDLYLSDMTGAVAHKVNLALADLTGIGEALAPAVIPGGSNYSPNWGDTNVATWAVTANRTLSNPTNVVPGKTIALRIVGSDATERTISWGSAYRGALPTATVSNAKGLLVTMIAISASEIVVSHVEYDL